MKPKKQTSISYNFLKWLLFLMLVAFIVTTVFLWVFQTRLANNNADNLLRLNIADVKADIKDATNDHMLEIVRSLSVELNDMDADNASAEEMSVRIAEMLTQYDVTEIDIINSKGIIVACNIEEFVGFDMASGEQSKEFLVLLDGEKEMVQEFQAQSYDSSIERKYAGASLTNGGFVQIGYDYAHLQKSVDQEVVALTRNRHVGNNGRVLIVDQEKNIVSNVKGIERKKLDLETFGIKAGTVQAGQRVSANVEGIDFYCMAEMAEGYYIISAIPEKEVTITRNMVVSMAVAVEVLIFIALTILIYLLIKKQIVISVNRINHSLSEITNGNLDVTMDVRNNLEFDSLSNDINATVDTLKRYIKDAEERIDAELAFAKAIQHSALPSVFPPYPNRKEFEIFATMHTAKEVGGDFYDFYFVDEDNLAFLIADVSGKGIPAAMFMMTSKTIIKGCTESGMSVEEVFTVANEKLCQGNEAGMFVTAWMGILNTKTGKVLFANAGHNPPLVKYSDGTYEYLKSRAGFVLAGMEGIHYRKNELQLQPGDAIYLYTDGVTEATNLNTELYGEERLYTVLEKYKDATPEELCDEVKKDVDAFVGEAPQFDDITMLALKYHGEEDAQ